MKRLMKKKGRAGSSFDDFLKEGGLYAEVTARAVKRVIARQLDAEMREHHLTKAELARRLGQGWAVAVDARALLHGGVHLVAHAGETLTAA